MSVFGVSCLVFRAPLTSTKTEHTATDARNTTHETQNTTMQSFWQKLWLWTRLVLISAGAIYILWFVVVNSDAVVDPYIKLPLFVKYEKPALLLVLITTAAVSILGWWLFWTILRTVRQIRDSRNRSKVERLTREVEDMKLKAARLQTKPATMIEDVDSRTMM
jgi:hypothetical protein